MPSTDTIIQLLSLATLAGDLFIVLALLVVLVKFLLKKPCMLTDLVNRYGLVLLFLIALSASSGSLYFSEIAKFTPCKECWFQRIFMYAQVTILLLAVIRRDRGIVPYILTLSVIGVLFSLSQYIGQVQAILIPSLTGTCGDPAANCSATEIFKYGYITIPVMAGTAFLMNALVSLVVMRRRS